MRRTQASFLVIACLGAAVVIHRPLRRIGLTVFRFPLVAAESLVGILANLPQLPSLAQDNAQLHRELMQRQLEVAQLREALRHATNVEALQESVAAQHASVVSIIGRTMTPAEHIVIVDRGEADGIRLDGVLIDVHGLVGRVVEVHPKTSLGMLITDPNSRVACLIERSRELGLLVGAGGSLCELIHLDLQADVNVDDQVVTAGLGGPFPKGIVVGTITKIERRDEDASTVAWVRPAVQLRQLEETLCLLPPPSSSSAL